MIFDELARCRRWIEGALKYADGTHTFDDVAAGVLSGRFQIWPLEQGVIVTEILAYPRAKTVHIFLAGGDLGELLGALPQIEDWGRRHGCAAISLCGRKGWLRVMGARGWRQSRVTMEKGL